MAYNKTKWEDLPSVETPISAENLNKIEQGIYDAHEQLDKLPQWSKEEEKPRYTADEVGAYSKEETKAFLDGKANAIITSVTGETIITTDSANATPSIELFGKSTQKTYQGNQLLNLPNVESVTTGTNITWSCKDGVVTVVGNTASETNSGAYIYQDIPIVADDYFVSGDGKYAKVFCKVTRKDGTVGYYNNRSFTLDGTETNAFVYVAIQNDGLNVDINETLYPMVNKGTNALPFEPYVGGEASPNLNYQQDVVPHGASGSIEQKFYSSNLCPKFEGKITHCGVTFDYKDGYVTITGTKPASDIEANSGSLPFKLQLPKGKYSMSTGNEAGLNVRITKADGSKQWKTNSFELDGNEQDVMLYCSIRRENTEVTVNETIPLQINMGEELLPYEEYKEPQVLTHQTPNGLHGIPLGATIPDVIKNSPIHMRGVYWDNATSQYYIGDTKNENGKNVQRVFETVFDGSDDEQWSIGSKDRYMSRLIQSTLLRPLENSKKASGLCTHFYIVQANDTYQGVVGLSVDIAGQLHCYTGETGITDSNLLAFKEKLASSPMKLYLVLKEPIVTDLTEEELAQYNAIHMNYPNTTIVNSDSAYTEVEYVADTKCYIDKKFKELETALANTNAQLL